MSTGSCAVALAVLLVCAPAQAGAPATRSQAQAEPNVSCARCLVVDESGRVLFARNPRDRYPIASTTKMVTALITVAHASLAEPVGVSAAAASIGGGGLDLQAGDSFTVEALLHALLLDSSNEAAVALAEHVAGSEAAFVEEMNAFAASIGATRTRFSNPHGLDAPEHYSSAADLARIGAVVLDTPPLDRIVATPDATIDTPRGPVVLENRNVLLETYPGAIGIKTGRTLGAGNILVAAAARDGNTLIAVAMNSFDSFADAAALLDFGFTELRRLRDSILVDADETVGALVFDGIGSVSVEAGATVRGLPPSDLDDLEVRLVPGHDVELPIRSGQEVGLVQVRAPGGVATVEAIAGEGIPDGDASWLGRALAGVLGAVGGLIETAA